MEEEKPQPPAPDHQLEPAPDVPIYYHVTIFDDGDEEEEEDLAAKEEEDRQSRAAAIAADEELAHRLYMQELMEMEEWELRRMNRRPSLRDLPLGDFPPSSSSCSRAGVGAEPGKFSAGTPPYATNARARGTFESVHEAESGAVFLGNSRIPGPLEALADERIREIRGKAANRGAGTNTTSRFIWPGPCDFATSPARRQTVLSEDAAGSSSTQNGPVSTKRRALLAEADSVIIFSGMEERDDNSWYESMVVPDDDDDEKPEQVEVQSLSESLQSCLLRSEPSCNPAAAATVAAQGHEFSLQDFCQRWGVTPSDVHPDEPSPSTRVPPVADHEVPTFDCGLCKDTLPVLDLFHGLPCEHRFCAPCVTAYVEFRIRAGELPIPCPDLACGVGGVLHPEKCKKAIDYATFGDWGKRLAENALPPARRAYCPNRQCRLLVETSGVAETVRAPCPACGHALVRKLQDVHRED